MSDWTQAAASDMMQVFGEPQAMLVRGSGCFLWDADGTEYLDFLGGIAVNALGHAHPVMVEAISRQAAELIHVSNYFVTPPQLELAARLKRLTGAGEAGRVYFSNSGAEANEAAFKLARLHSGSGARTRILALNGSFHGRTMGALALTGKPAIQTDFAPLPGGVTHIDATLDALEAEMDDTVAALIVEPIQGESGVVELPDGYLARARELTQENGALLILDEVQTGAGRTGDWFAFKRAGIVPDAITLAKGMGGGFPIGALVTFGAASDLFTPGKHGSTFSGNPLATATANAVLGEIEASGLVENARERGEQLRELILGIGSPLITGVRGRGLLLGIALAEPVAADLVRAALDVGLIINAPNPTTIRIAPPLTVGDDELRVFTERFTAAIARIAAGTPNEGTL
ncbi:acetylornithine transaminase [Mycetocola manganoxydans]|uniref:Acetylornithine aminotransferase n=1 Tax=Mycetocola manganoxydans TaxID=699879 RepID=A0A3L6ZPI7_9MICO|nr:acetylornithine transaminase [Mycetocola manganoxydans]RLP69737.1 acetylornithine transaminase [Mycetocola manganoxydans]GHD49838.1 acetylornithine aminotransferase [Mycetocola manganoxydans]